MTALAARLSRILANVPDATAFHVYDGRQLEAWLKEGKQARQDNSRSAPIPTRPAHRVAETGRVRAPDLLTIQDVAARWQVSAKQVRKIVDAGLLRYRNVGLGSKYRSMRFHPTDVDECIERIAKLNVSKPLGPSKKKVRRRGPGAEVIGFTARRLLKKKKS